MFLVTNIVPSTWTGRVYTPIPFNTSIPYNVSSSNSTSSYDSSGVLPVYLSGVQKVSLIAAYFICDWLRYGITGTAFHKSPTMNTFNKQMKVKLLPVAVVWSWFFLVVGIAVMNSNPEIMFQIGLNLFF